MSQKTLTITGDPIGEGQERICYRHPEDPDKIIKLQKGGSDNQIVFSEDLRRTNVLFQRLSPERAHLLVIDEFDNHSAINWFDVFLRVSDSKINRRWERCMRQLKIHSDEMIKDYGAGSKPLDPAYRRTG